MRIQKMRVRLDTAAELGQAFRLVGVRNRTFVWPAKAQPPWTKEEERVGRYIPPEDRAHLVGETLRTVWEEQPRTRQRQLCVSLNDEERELASGWHYFWADFGPQGSEVFAEEVLGVMLKASLGKVFDELVVAWHLPRLVEAAPVKYEIVLV